MDGTRLLHGFYAMVGVLMLTWAAFNWSASPEVAVVLIALGGSGTVLVSLTGLLWTEVVSQEEPSVAHVALIGLCLACFIFGTLLYLL